MNDFNKIESVKPKVSSLCEDPNNLGNLWGKLPSNLNEEQLEILRDGLKQRYDSYKGDIKDDLKNAIPFKPLGDLLIGNSDYKLIDGLTGATFLNIPMNLGLAAAKVSDLIESYRKLVKVQNEIKKRNKVEV